MLYYLFSTNKVRMLKPQLVIHNLSIPKSLAILYPVVRMWAMYKNKMAECAFSSADHWWVILLLLSLVSLSLLFLESGGVNNFHGDGTCQLCRRFHGSRPASSWSWNCTNFLKAMNPFVVSAKDLSDFCLLNLGQNSGYLLCYRETTASKLTVVSPRSTQGMARSTCL